MRVIRCGTSRTYVCSSKTTPLWDPQVSDGSQSRQYLSQFQRLRSDVDADRDVLAAFFAIRNFSVGVDFEFAFDGRVLVDDECHCLGFRLLLRQLLTCGGLIRCYG